MKTKLAALALTLVMSQGVAASVLYKFTGQLPTGSSSHTQVMDGETWMAIATIDEARIGTNNGGGAVLGVDLSFSGGFSVSLGGGGVFISLDQFDSASLTIDSVLVFLGASFFQVNAGNSVLLTDTTLPGVGFSMAPSPTTTNVSWNQIIYGDGFGNIIYSASDANNTRLDVLPGPTTTLPEPTTTALLVLGLLGVRYARKRHVR